MIHLIDSRYFRALKVKVAGRFGLVAFIIQIGMPMWCGCSHDTSKMDEDVADKITSLVTIIERGQNIREYKDGLCNVIALIPDHKSRILGVRKAIDEIHRIDVTKFQRKYKAVRDLDSIWNSLCGVWMETEWAQVEKWQVRMDHINWKKRQLVLLKRLEREESMHFPATGPVVRSLSDRVSGLRGAIKSLCWDLAADIDFYERSYLEMEGNVPEEQKLSIRGRLEGVFGRSLRTSEQIGDDARELRKKAQQLLECSWRDEWNLNCEMFDEHFKRGGER